MILNSSFFTKKEKENQDQYKLFHLDLRKKGIDLPPQLLLVCTFYEREKRERERERKEKRERKERKKREKEKRKHTKSEKGHI